MNDEDIADIKSQIAAIKADVAAIKAPATATPTPAPSQSGDVITLEQCWSEIQAIKDQLDGDDEPPAENPTTEPTAEGGEGNGN